MYARPRLRVLALAALAAPLAAGCASGSSHVESLIKEIHLFDAAAAVGALILASNPDQGWNTRVSEQGNNRYRIAVEREPWNGGGEGEFGRRFAEAAQRLVVAQSCGGYRVLSYVERLENAILGARRIAEGLIECT